MFNGQAHQDEFVLSILNNKKKGFYIEIGSNHPIIINNTYILEKKFRWTGIMIEYDEKWLHDYKKFRPHSKHIINDAQTIDYKKLFILNKVPLNIDYLQIDLDVSNGSTLNVLKKINEEVMNEYKFATVTFEHDIYASNNLNTREESRIIFKKRGYIRVFSDISNLGVNPYEDWYVHPDLVNMEEVNKIISKNKKNYKINKSPFTYSKHVIVRRTINWQDIIY